MQLLSADDVFCFVEKIYQKYICSLEVTDPLADAAGPDGPEHHTPHEALSSGRLASVRYGEEKPCFKPGC